MVKTFKFVTLILMVFGLGCADFRMDNISLGSILIATDCTNPSPDTFQSGSGTIADPYVICNIPQFFLIDDSATNLQSHYLLGSDLDFQALTFEPVGSFNEVTLVGEAFSGTFNGNNLAIENINYTTAGNDLSSGVFANTSNAVIRNLNLRNITITGRRRTGLLIGYGESTSVENLNVQGEILRFGPVDGAYRSGGVIGNMTFNTAGSYFFRNINVNANIQADDVSGVLYGLISNASTNNVNLTMENITSEGDVYDAGNNTLGGVGGMTDFRGDNINIVIRNLDHRGDVIIPGPDGGSWSGLMFGQFYVLNGSNSSLLIEDISARGNLTSIANFNQRGALSGLVANLILSNTTDIEATIRRVSVEGNISIIESGIGNNANIAGLIASLIYEDAVNADIRISDSYYIGGITSLNVNNLSGVAGLVSQIEANAGSVGSQVLIDRCYTEVDENIPSATITNMRAVVGRYIGPVNAVYNDVYFNAPASMLINGAEPDGSAGVVQLSPAQLLLQSSFTGFDFTNVWSINNGVSPPMLR